MLHHRSGFREGNFGPDSPHNNPAFKYPACAPAFLFLPSSTHPQSCVLPVTATMPMPIPTATPTVLLPMVLMAPMAPPTTTMATPRSDPRPILTLCRSQRPTRLWATSSPTSAGSRSSVRRPRCYCATGAAHTAQSTLVSLTLSPHREHVTRRRAICQCLFRSRGQDQDCEGAR